MPMYFPDLKSVQNLAKTMQNNTGDKQYKGIYPNTKEELPEARKQLGQYLRIVWEDTIAALEVELAVNEDNYDQRIGDHIRKTFLLNKI